MDGGEYNGYGILCEKQKECCFIEKIDKNLKMKKKHKNNIIYELISGFKDDNAIFYYNKSLTIYAGYFENNEYDGEGELYKDGIKLYKGYFKNGNIYKGIYYENEIAQYCGYLKKKYFNGAGALCIPGNECCDFKKSKSNNPIDEIKIVNDNNILYYGDFHKGKYNGIELLYDNGNIKYYGYFYDGKFHGKGLLYSNGILEYCGDFHEDDKEGEGAFCLEGQKCCKIDFKDNGKMIIYEDCRLLKYYGQLKENKYHGKGIYCENNIKKEYKFKNGAIEEEKPCSIF